MARMRQCQGLTRVCRKMATYTPILRINGYYTEIKSMFLLFQTGPGGFPMDNLDHSHVEYM